MKKLIIAIFATGTLIISSCTTDPCEGKSATTLCSGKGTLVTSGSTCGCNCDVGYEGADCATLTSAKFSGSWTALDNDGSSTVGPYTSSIAAGTASGSILIGNFSNLGSNVNATVSGNAVTISNQVLGTAYTVSGGGTFSKTTTGSSALAMTYKITQVSSGAVKNYTGTWTK
jgi:hypothetical protein